MCPLPRLPPHCSLPRELHHLSLPLDTACVLGEAKLAPKAMESTPYRSSPMQALVRTHLSGPSASTLQLSSSSSSFSSCRLELT